MKMTPISRKTIIPMMTIRGAKQGAKRKLNLMAPNASHATGLFRIGKGLWPSWKRGLRR